MKRVILKKTSYFSKNHKGLSKRISRYLENYVDEIGKAAQKRGEAPWKNKINQTEARWLLPVEKTGLFYTGGFLGEDTSPGSAESKKQKGWIKRFTSRYVRALEKSPKRRSDGYRFVMSMAPDAVAAITQSNISCDQAMREIWRTTMELYKERHGWNTPDEDVAWIAGAHHDTDNAHLHVLVFPTTKSGKLLRTNNARGSQRIDDLNELVAMANIATEIFWRELLPLNLQSQEFKTALAINPDQEPPLPTINTFKARSGIPGKRKEEETIASEPILVLDSKFKEDRDLEYGEISILSKLKKKIGLVRGRIQLRATVSIAMKWANKKLKFFGILKSLNDKEQVLKTKTSLSKEFPTESADIQSLENAKKTLNNKKTIKKLEKIINNNREYTAALLARIAGDLESNQVNDKTTLDWAGKLANVFENATTEKDTQTKLLSINKEGQLAKAQKQEEEVRTLTYRGIKRALEKSLTLSSKSHNIITPALLCINKMIRGSKRVSLVLEARTNEAKNSVYVSRDGKASMLTEKREWELEKSPEGFTFLVKENKGKPWPPHLDPDTVIEPLKDSIMKGIADEERELFIPRAKLRTTMELMDINKPIYKSTKEIDEESPLELILRLKGRKNLYRKKEALETIRRYRTRSKDQLDSSSGDESSELDLDGPDIEIT